PRQTPPRRRPAGRPRGAGILEPGDPEASHLIEVIRPGASPRMPYKQPPLSEAEIRLLELWVQQGAKFDGPSETETMLASLVDPLKDLPRVELKVAASDPITSLAFSADGKLLAAAHGRAVLLLDPASGRLLATLGDHPGPLTSVQISPDGKTLVAAGGRPGMFGAITLWDLPSRSRRLELHGHADSILSTALAPDGKTLASASYDRLVKLWDIVEGVETRTLKEHTDAVFAVAFSPDGSALASAGSDRTVKVWEVASGRKRVSLSDATAELYAVAFSPDGKTVLAGGVDRMIRAWDLASEGATLARTAFAHDAAVLRLVLAPDGKTLISSGEDKAVKLWDLATLAPRSALAPQPDWC
ncbi:MAG: WD40 repeat domain-containing protein, partial [Isosphaeraceae bacterium]|nr:WD40 repeat domain-containing protein [Isosphaeraceae bacterium]